MKFAKAVFTIAGIWGICLTVPLYFLFDFVSRRSPPAITHPEFYFGFAGVTFAWQIGFLLIAIDPARYRLMMIPSIIEKLTYVFAMAILLFKGRVAPSQAASSVPEVVLAVLFVAAFLTCKPANSIAEESSRRADVRQAYRS